MPIRDSIVHADSLIPDVYVHGRARPATYVRPTRHGGGWTSHTGMRLSEYRESPSRYIRLYTEGDVRIRLRATREGSTRAGPRDTSASRTPDRGELLGPGSLNALYSGRKLFWSAAHSRRLPPSPPSPSEPLHRPSISSSSARRRSPSVSIVVASVDLRGVPPCFAAR